MSIRERAIGRAFGNLKEVPGFKGAVILYLAEDAKSLFVKSTLPAKAAEALIQEAAAYVRGERGTIIVTGGN